MGDWTQAEVRRFGKDSLAAGGRGAREELGMPVADDSVRLKNRGGDLDLDQDDHGRADRDGRRGVHHNAERAVIGIGVHRMDVSHLDYCEQRQQDKTHHGGNRQSAWLCAAIPAEVCPECCQTTTPALRIHIIGCE